MSATRKWFQTIGIRGMRWKGLSSVDTDADEVRRKLWKGSLTVIGDKFGSEVASSFDNSPSGKCSSCSILFLLARFRDRDVAFIAVLFCATPPTSEHCGFHYLYHPWRSIKRPRQIAEYIAAPIRLFDDYPAAAARHRAQKSLQDTIDEWCASAPTYYVVRELFAIYNIVIM